MCDTVVFVENTLFFENSKEKTSTGDDFANFREVNGIQKNVEGQTSPVH